MKSEEYIVAENQHWSMMLTVDSEGVHIGTKPRDHQMHKGLYLTDDQQDELIFRLVQARRKRRRKVEKDGS